MGLMDKIKKASDEGDTFNDSKFMTSADTISTSFPGINVAFSGDIDGGFDTGITIFSGKPKHFKTGYSLALMKAYMDKYPEAVVLFYDSEFGASQEYFDSFNIDTSRVFHDPVLHIEELKFKIMKQLENLDRNDRVFVFVDSVGNLASKKESEDAKNQNSAADMSRAKEMKSLFRTITPYFSKLNIPMVAISHTYETMDFMSKEVVSGGTGLMYSANNIFIVGRRQNKKQEELKGYEFILKAEKSRSIKEGSKIPIRIDFDNGIYKYSGLLDMALQTGKVYKPKNGWYSRVISDENGELKEDKNWREDELLNSDEFWKPILEQTDFKQKVREMYQLGGNGPILEIEETIEPVKEEGESNV